MRRWAFARDSNRLNQPEGRLLELTLFRLILSSWTSCQGLSESPVKIAALVSPHGFTSVSFELGDCAQLLRLDSDVIAVCEHAVWNHWRCERRYDTTLDGNLEDSYLLNRCTADRKPLCLDRRRQPRFKRLLISAVLTATQSSTSHRRKNSYVRQPATSH